MTDGSKYAVGCGKQSQSNSFANCPAGVLECFYIDVQGGEVVSGKSLGYNRVLLLTCICHKSPQLTSFEMTKTDNSGVATSLGNFKFGTKNIRTGMTKNYEIGDTKGTFISVDVGSGMICGMKGRAGNLGKYFNVISFRVCDTTNRWRIKILLPFHQLLIHLIDWWPQWILSAWSSFFRLSVPTSKTPCTPWMISLPE